MLPQMTARLLSQHTLAGGLRTILNDVIALHGAEFGNIQLAIDNDTLALIEHRGFDQPSLQSLRRVARSGAAVSARAFASRKPVIIPDLFQDRALAPYHSLANAMGVRAMQATPLIDSGGKCVAVVSTHFANVHTPTEIEMETLSNTALSPPISLSATFKVPILPPWPTAASSNSSRTPRRRRFRDTVREARPGLRQAPGARASARFRRPRAGRQARR
jgi:GAF domain-containing protein